MKQNVITKQEYLYTGKTYDLKDEQAKDFVTKGYAEAYEEKKAPKEEKKEETTTKK